MCTGQLMPAVPLSLFFELFWLDLFPIGTYIPPMPAFPYLLLLTLSGLFGLQNPAELILPLALVMPTAYVVLLLEQKQRGLQKNASARLTCKAEQNQLVHIYAGRLITLSLLQQITGGLALFILAYGSAVFLLNTLGLPPAMGGEAFPINLDWSILYFIAATGALLSLRIRRAYSVFALCSAVLVCLHLL